MLAQAHARHALLFSLPALALSGCSSVDVMAERQQAVGLDVRPHLSPGTEHERIVDAITVTPLRGDRRYLLQVSSEAGDGSRGFSGYVGSWQLDVLPGQEGTPVTINLREWGTPNPLEDSAEVRAEVPREVNAAPGCNSVWVCEMSREPRQEPNGARQIYNTIWFNLEPR